jgi:hypothetical protein
VRARARTLCTEGGGCVGVHKGVMLALVCVLWAVDGGGDMATCVQCSVGIVCVSISIQVCNERDSICE